jgi:sugar/nucleoside kinase (ribokinase family)
MTFPPIPKFDKTVISVGDLVTDLVMFVPTLPVEAAQHQVLHNLITEPGGAGNFLIAGARLGLNMVALGAVGSDLWGASMLETLSREGIEVKDVVRLPGTTTTVAVLADDIGRHVFLGRYGEGPNLEYPAAWNAVIQKADAIFSYGYTVQEERMSGGVMQALRTAAASKCLVVFDPGPEMVKASPQIRDEVLSLADVLLMTEEEIPLMAGGQTGLETARKLLQFGPQVVVIKRGQQGCIVYRGEEEVTQPGFPVPVRDTSAAGDSFAAAFIGGYLEGWPLAQAACLANAMGAAKVQKRGSGTQVPYAYEVQTVLDEFGAGIHLRVCAAVDKKMNGTQN